MYGYGPAGMTSTLQLGFDVHFQQKYKSIGLYLKKKGLVSDCVWLWCSWAGTLSCAG